MQRVKTLLQKINELSANEKPGLIEIDLIMDYLRVLYADLAEQRGKMQQAPIVTNEPTLDELAKAMREEEAVQDEGVKEEEVPVNQIQFFPEEEPAMPIAPIDSILHKKQNDVRNYIGINDKYQLISELFGNDKRAYETTLDGMNSCTSLREALAWLDENAYRQYNWSNDSEAVQILYGILSNFLSEQ